MGPLSAELPQHRSCCGVAAAVPLRRSCRNIAVVARSPPGVLFGGVAATSQLLRGRRCRAPFGGVAATSQLLRGRRCAAPSADLPQHRCFCGVAAARSLRRSCRNIAAVAKSPQRPPLRRGCRNSAAVAGSPPRGLFGGVAAISLLLRGRRSGASSVELPQQRCFCEVAAAGPLRRSCRNIAAVARSLPRGFFGGVAATSLLSRGRRRGAPSAELSQHRCCCDVAAADSGGVAAASLLLRGRRRGVPSGRMEGWSPKPFLATTPLHVPSLWWRARWSVCILAACRDGRPG